MSWLPGEPFGYLTIGGLVTEMAGDFRLPRDDYLNNWQLGNTLVWTRGRNSARFGFQAQYLQFDQNTTSQKGGIVTWTNLENFLVGRPSNVDFAVPGLIDPQRKYRQWLFAGFAQTIRCLRQPDGERGRGTRWSRCAHEVDGRSRTCAASPTAMTVGDPWHENPCSRTWRRGIVWIPGTATGAGRLRSSRRDPPEVLLLLQPEPAVTTRTTIANRPFPNVIATRPERIHPAQLQTTNFAGTPASLQFNLGVQRSLVTGTRPRYVAPRKNLIRLGDATWPPRHRRRPQGLPVTALPPRVPSLHGDLAADRRGVFYNSAQVVRKRFSGGWRAQVSYTFSRVVTTRAVVNSQIQQRRPVQPGLVRPETRPRAGALPRRVTSVQLDLGPALLRSASGVTGRS